MGNEGLKLNSLGINQSKLDEFINPSIDLYDEGTILYQAQRFDQRSPGEFFSTIRPVDSLDAEILFDIKRFNNNANQVATFKVTRSAELLNGQVKGGTGTQVWIPRDAVKNYVEKINVEPLFVSFPKAIKR